MKPSNFLEFCGELSSNARQDAQDGFLAPETAMAFLGMFREYKGLGESGIAVEGAL